MLRTIPSLERRGKSVTDDILDFDHCHQTRDAARLIDAKGIRNRGDADDARHMQFSNRDRYLLAKLMLIPEPLERRLNDISIERWFESSPHLFTTNFWYMWQTTFAFQKGSSAMELRPTCTACCWSFPVFTHSKA